MIQPQSFMPVLVFSAVAYLADLLGVALAGLQKTVIGVAFTGTGLVIGGVSVVVGLFEEFVVNLHLIDTAASLLAFVYAGQFVLSLFILVLFFSIAYVSPKGVFTLSDYIIASAVFFLEAMPILCGFFFWGAFAVYLRRSSFSGFSIGQLKK